jgi:glutamate formiminotransferase/formiminotetrahydrofolate cyclodeaminase
VADVPGFRSLTLDAFVQRLASSDPVPGGGSASAVAASLGASLVTMVAALSEGRPKYADHAALHEEAKAAGARLADRFLTLADDDAAAYAEFSAALKLPKDTDEERAARQQAISHAARGASDVPLACVEACYELVTFAEAMAGRSNRNASSDLEVAAVLAKAAATGAAANVLVNLPSIGDEAYAGELTVRVTRLLDDIERTADATRETVRQGEARDPLDGPVIAPA